MFEGHLSQTRKRTLQFDSSRRGARLKFDMENMQGCQQETPVVQGPFSEMKFIFY